MNQQRTPWHTEQWFTSAWNHDPGVVDHHFALQVEIHDVTVRDGEQQAGVEFTADDITEAVPFDPRLVGEELPLIVLGKGSGIDNINAHLERIGREASEEQKLELLGEVKNASLQKKDLLDETEFTELASHVLDS